MTQWWRDRSLLNLSLHQCIQELITVTKFRVKQMVQQPGLTTASMETIDKRWAEDSCIALACESKFYRSHLSTSQHMSQTHANHYVLSYLPLPVRYCSTDVGFPKKFAILWTIVWSSNLPPAETRHIIRPSDCQRQIFGLSKGFNSYVSSVQSNILLSQVYNTIINYATVTTRLVLLSGLYTTYG